MLTHGVPPDFRGGVDLFIPSYLLRGGYKRGPHAFQGGQGHHGRFDTAEEEKGGGGGKETAGESVLATPLWGMLYADDAGVVS